MVKLLFGNNFTNDICFFKASDIAFGGDIVCFAKVICARRRVYAKRCFDDMQSVTDDMQPKG